ncbi:hypothetical protein BC943DRAFT_356756 [Umbelopsis sp. AD052]|nr:hypothetical protein BC943DRAFT_356756 [Umbelopsis sp. AD052]
MQSHNRSLSSAMISHDLQDWLTRTSAEPAPLPNCCCEQSTCPSSELFHDTIKRLEGESRLAAEIGQSLLLKYEKFVQEDEHRRREYEQKLFKTEEKIKKLRSINDDLEKHNEDLTLKNNKLTWEHEKAQQTINVLLSDLELSNHRVEKLAAENESKNAEIEKTRILRMLSRQADLRDELNETKIDDLKQELALSRKNEMFLESKHKKLLARYESLQNSADNLKQENRVLAEEAEGAQSAEWLRHVNDRLRTSELKNSLSESVDIRPQQYHHLISLIKELGFSNNKLKNELAEYKDMLSDSRAEVTLLNAKLEHLEVSDDGSDFDPIDAADSHHSDNSIVTRQKITETDILMDDPEHSHLVNASRSYSTSVPHDHTSPNLMKNNLSVRRSATTMRSSDQLPNSHYNTRSLTAPLYLDSTNNISNSTLSSPTETPTVVHHHYHYHVHKSKNAGLQEIGQRSSSRKHTGAAELYINEELAQSRSLVAGKSLHTTDISKPVVTSVPSSRRKSLLSTSLNDLSRKQELEKMKINDSVSKKMHGGHLHTQWSTEDGLESLDESPHLRGLAASSADAYAGHSSNIPELSLCKDAPYHSLHHLGVHYFERLKATDIRALNRQLRRAFDILEISSMSNSIIDNVLADVKVLKSRFLWVEQNLANNREMGYKVEGEYAPIWESDVSMEDFFPLVELTETLLSEIGQMRMTLNDLQVEYVNKVELIEHQAEKDILHKRELRADRPPAHNDGTFSWFTNILARYNTKEFDRTPSHLKRHKRTVSHESITSQLMERMEEEDQSESTKEGSQPKEPTTKREPRAPHTTDSNPYLSSSFMGMDALIDPKLLLKSSAATLIPRASRSTGTLRKSQSSTRPKEAAKSSTLRQYLSTTLSGSLSDYYHDDSRPATPDVDWKIANGIGTRRFYK